MKGDRAMRNNMGAIDRTIRTLAALAVAVLYFTGTINGIAAIVLGVLAVIFLITSFIGFCPLYTVIGIDTKKKKE
jgi:hypothetical protein